MIEDKDALRETCETWDGARKMRERMKLLSMTNFAVMSMGGHLTADALNSLPLLLAFEVLGQVLKQLKRQKTSPSKQQAVAARWTMRSSTLVAGLGGTARRS